MQPAEGEGVDTGSDCILWSESESSVEEQFSIELHSLARDFAGEERCLPWHSSTSRLVSISVCEWRIVENLRLEFLERDNESSQIVTML